MGATGLAPVCHSEAALRAAAFAARPHPHDGSGRGGPTAVCSWHLCTGGWSLRGDVRGTCPRSPCTVPAMCADVSPSAASRLTAPAVPAPGRMVVSWPVAPVLAGSRRSWGSSCRRSCSGRGPLMQRSRPRWWGRLLCGSSMKVECPTKVVPGGCAAGRCPGGRRRDTPHWPWA